DHHRAGGTGHGVLAEQGPAGPAAAAGLGVPQDHPGRAEEPRGAGGRPGGAAVAASARITPAADVGAELSRACRRHGRSAASHGRYRRRRRPPGGQRSAPTTAHRPDRQRPTTAASRSSMNTASPVQIPTSPQPKLSDSQINGRKPSMALANVAFRRNFASPAPSNTPSRANTTPAIGCSSTKNHQAPGTSASTPASDVNAFGNTPCTDAKMTSRMQPKTRP